MTIIYESKTGFTKKYAQMLGEKTNLKVISTKELARVNPGEEVIFLGWLKAGKIQGLKKVRKCKIKVVCATGAAEKAEPDEATVKERNAIGNTPFFYLQGGCLPVDELKGMDKFLMKMFVKMLKTRPDKAKEAENIEKGFNGVKEENLEPLLKWLNG